MFTTLNHLTTTTQCDEVLKMASRQQKMLLVKKLTLELQIERRIDEMAELEFKLSLKAIDLEHATTVAADLPESNPDRKKKLEAIPILEYELAILEIRKGKMPPQWLVQKELQLHVTEAAMEQMGIMILELETHKARLQKEAAKSATGANAATVHQAPPVLMVPFIQSHDRQKNKEAERASPNGSCNNPQGGFSSA